MLLHGRGEGPGKGNGNGNRKDHAEEEQRKGILGQTTGIWDKLEA